MSVDSLLVDALHAKNRTITAAGELARALIRADVVVANTPRNAEILRLYQAGESIAEIGARLGIGSGPVKAALRACGIRVPA